MRNLDEIRKDLEDMEKMSCKPTAIRPKTGTFIDEEKSVRWNKEEVVRQQETYDAEVKRLNQEKNKRRDSLYSELYKVIKSEVKGISIGDAKSIFGRAYEEGHSYGYAQVFSELDDLMSFVSDIVNHKND